MFVGCSRALASIGDWELVVEASALTTPVSIGDHFKREFIFRNLHSSPFEGKLVVEETVYCLPSLCDVSVPAFGLSKCNLSFRIKANVIIDDLPSFFHFILEANGGQVSKVRMGTWIYDFLGNSLLPPNHSTSKKYNILLFGLSGAGKSSLINSMLTAVSKSSMSSNQAVAGGSANHVTKTVGCYPLAPNVQLWDVFGLTQQTFQGCELEALLSGKVAPGSSIDQVLGAGGQVNGNPTPAELQLRVQRRIHSLLFVVPQAAIKDPALSSVRELLSKHFSEVSKFGLNPLVVLTKVDELSPDFLSEPNRPREDDHPVESLRTRAAQVLNVSKNKVLCGLNYHHQRRKNFEIDKLNFAILNLALLFARDAEVYFRSVL